MMVAQVLEVLNEWGSFEMIVVDVDEKPMTREEYLANISPMKTLCPHIQTHYSVNRFPVIFP
jgi:hypothetical protein